MVLHIRNGPAHDNIRAVTVKVGHVLPQWSRRWHRVVAGSNGRNQLVSWHRRLRRGRLRPQLLRGAHAANAIYRMVADKTRERQWLDCPWSRYGKHTHTTSWPICDAPPTRATEASIRKRLYTQGRRFEKSENKNRQRMRVTRLGFRRNAVPLIQRAATDLITRVSEEEEQQRKI